MSHLRINRIVALCVFIAASAIYLITLSPTVVFWDVGEFIAAAKLLQVPHPPGSPLFLLLARIAMMIPFAADQAVRAHTVSALLSAGAIMFLYLVIVRLVTNFRGIPETIIDKITVHGVAVIGAFSLALGSTYWDNSIEAEVYGASMFFLSAIMWLAMRWLDRADSEGNEKYILLIAYLIGLSLGVHLLALLAIFPVLMVIYFRKYEVTLNSFAKFSLIAVAVFWVVYPGIVKWLPGMMDGEFAGKKSVIIEWIPWILIALACYGAYTSYKKKQKMLHIALVSSVLIFLGYTTYTSVIIRSNEHPPMNENDPSNLARLTAYLGREQYGDAPLFLPRRYSQEPHQQGIYKNYSGEFDYLWRYQLNHMFTRYLLWNYAGQEGDFQDARANLYPFNGVLNAVAKAVNKTQPFGGEAGDSLFCIPLIVGLLGLYYQFKMDWKMGLVFMTAFIILGPVLALYQNQQEPQPRERDYFYVGAFYVFSIWIAIGLIALVDYIRKLLQPGNFASAGAIVVIVLFAVAVPVNQARLNWHEHDRSGDYVAWDYSYNLLQTCEKDAILFTNGDNDTFPVWYLQDVEGIRRDVRLVNLSLINTPWYIQQMKGKPYYPEALPVPISIPDQRIERIQPTVWEPRMLDIPVPQDVFARYGVTDTAEINQGKISFLMRNTLQFGQTKAIRIQDIMVRDIIMTNQWKRPIYFAVTCSPDSRIGLDDYLWFHGLAWRLEPRKVVRDDFGLDPTILETNLFKEPEGFSKTPQYGYKFRRLADPKVYFDENVSRLMLNYRSAFLRLAMYQVNISHDSAGAVASLDRMEQLIPRSKVPMSWDIESELAFAYHRLGQTDKFNELAGDVEAICKRIIDLGRANANPYYSPYRVLLEIYSAQKQYGKSLDLLKGLALTYPNDPGLKQRISEVEQQMKLQSATMPPPTQ